MLIDKISIRSFRSIKKADIPIQNISALVGENNSGKSAVLRALNAFFHFNQEMESFKDGTHKHSQNSIPKIEITFSDLPNESEINRIKNGDFLIIQLTCRNHTSKPIYKFKKGNKFQPLDSKFFDAVKKHIDFVFVPPNRDLNKFRWEENTLLRRLVEAYLDNAYNKRDTLTKPFSTAIKEVEKNALSKISRQIKSAYALKHNYKFNIQYEENLTYRDFLSNIRFNVEEHAGVFDLAECGTGVQSLAIIAMYKVLSQLTHSNIIFGLEEPETNLHPQAQREFIRALSQSLEAERLGQIIFTTHSTVIIDQLNHEQVVLFRKVHDEQRHCGFRTEARYITTDFWTVNDLHEFNYYQFHRYKNSELFFAKYVIIVEGKSDQQVVQKLLEDEGYKLENYGISILPLDSVDNLKYPYLLLKALEIPTLAIVDKDYFLDYLNDDWEQSLDNFGYPKYKNEYSTGCLIHDMIPTQRERAHLLTALLENHTGALNILERHSIVSMKHSLEVDIVATRQGREAYYEILHIPENKRYEKFLLYNNYRSIKKIGIILQVLSRLPKNSLPRSYSRIKKIVTEKIRDIERFG